MRKISLSDNKILKLNNVLRYKVRSQELQAGLDCKIEEMENYIRIKGNGLIGPLIQFAKVTRFEEGELNIEIALMLQCNNYIHNVEPPYSMESVIRVSNCMYCRYIGPEDKLKYAYDKIHLEAFENDIELEDCNYTIFVDRNEEDETIVADVFIPRKDAK